MRGGQDGRGYSLPSPYIEGMNHGGSGAATVNPDAFFGASNGMLPTSDSRNFSVIAKPLPPHQKFIKLPFYETRCEIFGPVSLRTSSVKVFNRPQEILLTFGLNEYQANLITMNRDMRPSRGTDFEYQILFRIGQVNTNEGMVITDEFPPNFSLTVAGMPVQLPNIIPSKHPDVEPKRPPKPLGITHCCKLSPSFSTTMLIKYTPEFGKGWGFGVWFVQKLNAKDLLTRLRQKNSKSAEATRNEIIEKLSDGDIQLHSLKILLTCPLSKMRMRYPCRPTTCNHLNCFDAEMFLMMNEKKPTWDCGFCGAKAFYDDLVLDEYFFQMLSSTDLPSDAVHVNLLPDGSWTAIDEDKEKKATQTAKKSEASEVEVVDLSSDDEDAAPPLPPSSQHLLPLPVEDN